MATIHLVPPDITDLYEVHEWRNAAGVLSTACPKEWRDILSVLRKFRLLKSEVVADGGNKSPITRRLDRLFVERGWVEKEFATSIVVDGKATNSPTHAVDCFKGRVALEIEWNNKDPFYDRDLNNFRLLFDLRAIDVGVIITRCDELRAIAKSVGKSYDKSTTWISKLIPRIEGGGGGGCPILVFGIKGSAYVED